MDEWQMEAEREMWDAAAASDPGRPLELESDRPADEDRAGGRNTLTRRASGDLASGELESFAEEHEGGQTRLAVAGEQRSLLPLPDLEPDYDDAEPGRTPAYDAGELLPAIPGQTTINEEG